MSFAYLDVASLALGCAGRAAQPEPSTEPQLNEPPPEEPQLFTPAAGY